MLFQQDGFDNYITASAIYCHIFADYVILTISAFKIMLSEVEVFCDSLEVAFKSMRLLSLLSLSMQR